MIIRSEMTAQTAHSGRASANHAGIFSKAFPMNHADPAIATIPDGREEHDAGML